MAAKPKFFFGWQPAANSAAYRSTASPTKSYHLMMYGIHENWLTQCGAKHTRMSQEGNQFFLPPNYLEKFHY